MNCKNMNKIANTFYDKHEYIKKIKWKIEVPVEESSLSTEANGMFHITLLIVWTVQKVHQAEKLRLTIVRNWARCGQVAFGQIAICLLAITRPESRQKLSNKSVEQNWVGSKCLIIFTLSEPWNKKYIILQF